MLAGVRDTNCTSWRNTLFGADVGSALIARVLTFDLSSLSPLLIFISIIFFIGRKQTREGKLGRISIGLGSEVLELIVQGFTPITQANGLQVIFALLTGAVPSDWRQPRLRPISDAVYNSGANGAALHAALGSLLFKQVGRLLILPFVHVLADGMQKLPLPESELVIYFHVFYNEMLEGLHKVMHGEPRKE